MAKKSDRVFHLTISAIALALTVVSASSLLYLKDPAFFKQSLATMQLYISRFTGYHFGSNGLFGNVEEQASLLPLARSTSGLAKDIGAVPLDATVVNPMEDSKMVQVRQGGDVSLAQVNQVEKVLQSQQIIEKDANMLDMNLAQQVTIYVTGDKASYEKQLAAIGVTPAEAKEMSMDTGGFTLNREIVVPLYQNTHPSELVNTLGHELTHAFLNENVGHLPSWIDEGTAVHDGMTLQSEAENPLVYEGYAKQLVETVLTAATSGNLLPLTNHEANVIRERASYDLELQDWLAVNELIDTYGNSALHHYFTLIRQGVPSNTAFFKVYHQTPAQLNQRLTRDLKNAAQHPDAGVSIELQMTPSFAGRIEILQHGAHIWYGFEGKAGTLTIQVLPSGKIHGTANQVLPSYDADRPDEDTLYVNLAPTHTLKYQNQNVENVGFAIDYHYGMYSFVNSWIGLENGRILYSKRTEQFGVQIVQLKDRNMNPIQHLID